MKIRVIILMVAILLLIVVIGGNIILSNSNQFTIKGGERVNCYDKYNHVIYGIDCYTEESLTSEGEFLLFATSMIVVFGIFFLIIFIFKWGILK